MDYKKTLNLPRTDFPMKGNLAKREPEIQDYWREIGLYGLILEKRESAPLFILHDGPPYANGDIHVGTAYNKIIKDIIVKYKTMRGYLSPYVPGWDCHGQPIEHEVTKRLGKGDIDKMEIREKCREYAMKFIQRQSSQFQRLGVLGDFEDPYLTLKPSYEATNIEVFGELCGKGLIYRGSKPIHWCTNCVTALAEAEIEYEDKKSDSIYVRFPLGNEFPPLTQSGNPVSVLIWTTTPWTLPANVAIALHPGIEYAGVDIGDEILVMAVPLIESVMQDAGVSDYQVLDSFAGKEMEGLKCSHPWSERDSVLVLADYVTLDQGTGCVHTAPGHGQEDYLTGLEYDLPEVMPVDDLGYFTEEAAPFQGIRVHEANTEIIRNLREKGLLFSSTSVIHQYPHCWRCKNPVIFRATPQWFIDLDRDIDGEESLRFSSLDSIEKVDWIPEWTVNRIGSMVETRPDWCISRQRSWGVPLPILYCNDCDHELITAESLTAIKRMVAEEGADAWFRRKPREFLPEGTACSVCGGDSFRKEEDIIDVWFESGISSFAVLKKRDDLRWPADLYLEGSDQHRGWFQSSLLLSVGCEHKPPYRAVLTHGFTVDGGGRKMSKSLGNAIDPRDVYEKSGADILRLWTATTDYSSDMPISEEILLRVTEAYRRIRNTVRFLIGNTSDFDLDVDGVPPREMEQIDLWMLSRLQRLIERVTDLMDRYLFHQAFQAIHLYCTVDLSSLYLDILKDRLYTFPVDSTERRSGQTALAKILKAVNLMIAPVLAHTAEEIWLALPGEKGDAKSVHLLDWPVVDEDLVDDELEERWGRLLEIREHVNQRIEVARQGGAIGSGLEAKVKIFADDKSFGLLEEMLGELPFFFIVSQVEIACLSDFEGEREGPGEYEALVENASGCKCERCWNYSETVGENEKYPDICERCVEAIESVEP